MHNTKSAAVTIFDRLACLDPDQLYVVVGRIWANVPEASLAVELTDLRGVDYTRERVHRIYRTACRRMLRANIEPARGAE